VIVDPHPVHRRARPWAAPHESLSSRLGLALKEAVGEGLAITDLPVRLGAPANDVVAQLDAAADVIRLAGRVFDPAYRDQLLRSLDQFVEDYHRRHPLDPGLALQTIRAQLTGRTELVDDVIRLAVERGTIELEGGVARRSGWTPKLSADQATLKVGLLEALRSAGAEPPSVGELAEEHGTAVAALIRLLEREGAVIPVDAERYYETNALSALVEKLRKGMIEGRLYSPSELRDVIGLSRKFLIPFLEYCDRKGITERRSAGRVLHGT